MAAFKESILAQPPSFFRQLADWKNLFFPLLILVLLLAIAIGSGLLPRPTEREEESVSQVLQTPANALYISEGDTTGRTLFYAKEEFLAQIYFGGIGEQERELGPAGPGSAGVKVPYLVGAFSSRGWEEISGGYYIYLEDPQTKQQIGQMRLRTQETESSRPTPILVEDVTTPRPTQWLAPLGSVADFSKEELAVLVQPGDAVVVEILQDGEEPVRDENGVSIANRLIIRRIGGLEQLK